LLGNIENSAPNENIMTQELILDQSKMEEKFTANNKPLPKRMSKIKENDFT
jgi:hypothetical protein